MKQGGQGKMHQRLAGCVSEWVTDERGNKAATWDGAGRDERGKMRVGKEPRLGKKTWISLSAAYIKGTFKCFFVFSY